VNQLTIRGFGKDLEKRLRELARSEGLSLNQAALRLLRKGAGLSEEREEKTGIGAALDRHFGTWTEGEAKKFRQAVEIFETIDQELWK
jgi:hypothetical protein